MRFSHSGDGCGDSWPLCQGQLLPGSSATGKTWVELAHRATSGLFGILVVFTFLWARKIFPANSLARKAAKWSVIFTITEALLGAKLVLFGLVMDNDSPFRAFAMGLHFANSMMLTGSLILTWDFAQNLNWRRRAISPWTNATLNFQKIATSCVWAFALLGCTGAIASLSSTLFPSQSLLGGLTEDFAAGSHYLIRLRGIHPILGILIGGSLALSVWISTQLVKENETTLKSRGTRLAGLAGFEIAFGITTLFLLYPLWMKLTHLAVAHLIWIHLVLWVRELRYLGEDSSGNLGSPLVENHNKRTAG